MASGTHWEGQRGSLGRLVELLLAGLLQVGLPWKGSGAHWEG